MRVSNTEYQYPYPVLNEYLRDFTNGEFGISIKSYDSSSEKIVINIAYELDCQGIEKLINDGYAKVIVRVICSRTSYREAFDLVSASETSIMIPKELVIDSIYIQGIVIATQEYKSYNLNEFNKEYFGDYTFTLRKGDIIASEQGIDIQLRTILEKSVPGIIKVASDSSIDMMKVNYAAYGEDDSKYSDYIYIRLPKNEHNIYQNLTKKKHLKFGIERFLQASIVLPVIVEGIMLIQLEEDQELQYSGTIWAESIKAALEKKGIEDIYDTPRTCVEMANMILNDVTSDALNDLMQKMKEFSTIRQEDDLL